MGTIFIASYAILDWEGLSHPFDLPNVTPWAPSSGLTYALILVFGRKYLWLGFVGDLVAHIAVRPLVVPLIVEVGSCLIVGLGHGLCALGLLNSKLNFNPKLATIRDVQLLTFVAGAGAVLIQSLDLALITLTGQAEWQHFSTILIRSWIADVIGVLVLAPFLIFLLTDRRQWKLDWEFIAQIFCTLISFLVMARWGLQYFYILFLPIVWMAVSGGLANVSIGMLLTQFGLIATIHLSSLGAGTNTDLEARLLVLTLTGLAAGALVSERRRAEQQLRTQQMHLARRAQIDSVAELAGALAHEINQPLTAAGTYARIAAAGHRSSEKDNGTATEALLKAVAQIERAVAVVTSLRNLMRTGNVVRRPCALLAVVKYSLSAMQFELESSDAVVTLDIPPDLPQVKVDEISLQQVFINLVRNAVESLRDGDLEENTITISARHDGSDFIEMSIRDSGPGFPELLPQSLPLPFQSSKVEGLGVGLSLCRSIIEEHGGRFWIEAAQRGANVCFTLPVSEPNVS